MHLVEKRVKSMKSIENIAITREFSDHSRRLRLINKKKRFIEN